MKKEYFSLLLVLSIFLTGLIACNDEDAIPYVAPEESPAPTNPTDSAIQVILEKYQSKIIYKWDRRYVSASATASPALFENVLPYIEFMQEYWFDAYDSLCPGFSRNNLPIEIVLVGSSISYTDGEEDNFNAAGMAMSMARVLLTGVNELNPSNKAWVRSNAPTMHHEFAHILDKKYGRPFGYDEISKGLYAGNTKFSNFTMEVARERGFWRNYGMSNEAEDFATFVEGIVTNPREEVEKIIHSNSKLEAKYKMVYNYYKNLGIDLHELYAYLAKRWN